MPKIFSLAADSSLRKTYARAADGSLSTISYPQASEFSSTEHRVTTVDDFAQVIQTTADQNHCLIKGLIAQPLLKESRAGATEPHTPTEWICLDVDGLPGINTPEAFLKALGAPFTTTSCVIQYSASHGIKDDALRCHIFMLLAAPIAPAAIKDWLYDANYRLFSQHIQLNKNKKGLRFPLDVSTCQNDKLLYVAPPLLKGDVTSTHTGERIYTLSRRNPTLKFNFALSSRTPLRTQFETTRNQLRQAEGLSPILETDYRLVSTVDGMVENCLAKGEPITITGQRESNGYMRFNFNGGDSWGYYHRIDQPEIIYNFKNEEPIYTPILLPDYWKALQPKLRAAKQQKTEQRRQEREERHRQYLELQQDKLNARLEREYKEQERRERREIQAREHPIASDGYRYFGCWDKYNNNAIYYGRQNPDTLDQEIFNTTVRKKAEDYFLAHDQDIPAYLDHWDVSFRFDDAGPRIDFDAGRINLYEPTIYMQRPKPSRQVTAPTTINKILSHALGNDPDCYEAFVNWLAFIVQYKRKAKTAWVLHGHTGTGKGLIVNNVLRPILGPNYVARTSIATLANTEWNSFLEQGILVVIDESDVENVTNRNFANAKLKEYITESDVTLNKKYVIQHTIRNYSNFIVLSNETLPILINTNDRRWSVAKRQDIPYPNPPENIEELIAAELEQFTDFLLSYPVNANIVRTPFKNHDRELMQQLGRTSFEEIVYNIQSGNFAFFVEYRPDSDIPPLLIQERTGWDLPTYDQALDQLIEYPDRLSRNALQSLFIGITNHITPAHTFTLALKKHGLRLAPSMRVGHIYRGSGLINLNWNFTEDALSLLHEKRQAKRLPQYEPPASVQPSQSQAQKPKRSSRLANRSSSGLRVVK